jgi:hypothetical protein
MQDSLFSDLGQILPHLARLEQKIEALRWIAQQLDSSDVMITLLFRDGTKYAIDQDLIPFKLQMELKTLTEDSIDEYQRQHEHLKKLFDATNF